MTLQEVIKSSKEFKRPCYENWFFVDKVNKIWAYTGKYRYIPSFSVEDILADDWVVKGDNLEDNTTLNFETKKE